MTGSLAVEAFYEYGFEGRRMVAIRAPMATGPDARELIGRTIAFDGRRHVVQAVRRQITGPIALGEPIGVEIADAC